MEKKSLSARIIIFVLVMAAIISMMTIVIRGGSTTGKYDSLITSLKDSGAKFYGAFWCPHCQAQEKALGQSRQQLEAIGLYTECSLSDGQGQTPICIDKKIESYPTWTFKDGIRITSDTDPIVCDISPGKPDENPECKKVGSTIFKRWIFPSSGVVASVTEPTHKGNTWTFDSNAQLRGEISIPQLATEIGVVLPDTNTKTVTTGAASAVK